MWNSSGGSPGLLFLEVDNMLICDAIFFLPAAQRSHVNSRIEDLMAAPCWSPESLPSVELMGIPNLQHRASSVVAVPPCRGQMARLTAAMARQH